MSNFYALWNRETAMFRKADGEMTGDINEAEQMALHDALEKEIELFAAGEKFVELCEVPLMHEGLYADAMAIQDPAGEFFDAHGIDLTVEIGLEDETSWTLVSRTTGDSVKVILQDCYSFKVTGREEGEE